MRELSTVDLISDIRKNLTKEFMACELNDDQMLHCIELSDGNKYRAYNIACETMRQIRNHFNNFQTIDEMRDHAKEMHKKTHNSPKCHACGSDTMILTPFPKFEDRYKRWECECGHWYYNL